MKTKIADILSKIILILRRPDMNILPGHLAFFFVLALIPLLTLVTFFATIFNIPIHEISNTVGNLPNGIVEILKPAFTATSITFGNIIILLISFFVASNGADAVILTSNKLYNINKSSIVERRIKAIIVTIIFICLFLFMLLIPVFGNIIIELISNFVNDTVYKSIKTIYNILQFPLSLLFVYFNIKVIYTIAPDKKIKSKDVSNGAVFTTISWVVISQIYAFYINNLANYSRIYGNFTNIIILMLFIYLLSTIFVIGMALNAYKNELNDEISKTGRMNIIKSIHNI